MEIPTVKSCCCFDLKTAGLMLGFFQLFVYGLIMLINLYFGGYLLLPIILMPIAINLSWIYGIQEKKPMLLLPTMVPFVLAILACICTVTIFPIGVGVFGPAIALGNITCTTIENSRSCVSEKYIDTNVAAIILGVWIAICVTTSIVTYLTIVLYSVYKFVDEDSKRNHQRLSATSSSAV